jgi:hypothetical protein
MKAPFWVMVEAVDPRLKVPEEPCETVVPTAVVMAEPAEREIFPVPAVEKLPRDKVPVVNVTPPSVIVTVPALKSVTLPATVSVVKVKVFPDEENAIDPVPLRVQSSWHKMVRFLLVALTVPLMMTSAVAGVLEERVKVPVLAGLGPARLTVTPLLIVIFELATAPAFVKVKFAEPEVVF